MKRQKKNTVNCTQAVRKTCKYGLYGIQQWTCDYIGKAGHMRGCPCEECDKYVKVKNPGRKTPWRLKRN